MYKTQKSKDSRALLELFRNLKTTTKRTKMGSRAMVGKGMYGGHKTTAVRYKTKGGATVTKITMII